MKKVLLLIAVIFSTAAAFAQMSDVTLTVIGTGATEEIATQNALRRALEEAYGAFLVSRTSIVMDELASDEIVVNTNGQVKELKYNAISTLPNGQISVSVTATVSMQKLISYAQGKGSEVAFMGDAFVANLKMMQLKVDNATKTLQVLTKQLEDLSESLFSFTTSITDSPYPSGSCYNVPVKLTVCSNHTSHQFYTLLENTLSALKLTESDQVYFLQMGLPISHLALGSNVYEIIWFYNLPIDEVTIEEFRERIRNCIFSPLYRVNVQEIGSNKIHDIWSLYKDNDNGANLDVDYATSLDRNYFISERFKIYEFHLAKVTPHSVKEQKIAKKNKQKLTFWKDSVVCMETPIIELGFTLEIPKESMSSFQGFKLIGNEVFTPSNLLTKDNQQLDSIYIYLRDRKNHYISQEEVARNYQKNSFDVYSPFYNGENDKMTHLKGDWYKRDRDGRLILKLQRKNSTYLERFAEELYLLHGEPTKAYITQTE